MENSIQQPIGQAIEVYQGHDASRKIALQSVQASASGPNLKTLKYRKLPSITTPSESPSPPQRHSSSALSSMMIVKIILGKSDRMPSSSIYYVGMRAQSHTAEEFRELYDRFYTFFMPKRSTFCSTDMLSITREKIKDSPLLQNCGFVAEVMKAMLNDIFQDPSIQSLSDTLAKEPIPYFRPREESKVESTSNKSYSFNIFNV